MFIAKDNDRRNSVGVQCLGGSCSSASTDISLLRSSQHCFRSAIYKHFVPTGLVVLAFALVVALRDSAIARLLIAITDGRIGRSLRIRTPTSRSSNTTIRIMRACRVCFVIDAKRIRRDRLCREAMVTCLAPDVTRSSSPIHAGPICTICHTDAQSGKLKAVSAIEQLQHEIRSRAPRENGQRWLRYLSSTFAWRRGAVDSGGIQRAYHLLSMSQPATRSQATGTFLPAVSAINRVVMSARARRQRHFASASVMQSTIGRKD